MSDWADETATTLADWFDPHCVPDYALADALRRAKADGLREAADMVENTGWISYVGSRKVSAGLRTAADKLSPSRSQKT